MGLQWSETDLEARQLRLAATKASYSLRPLGQPAANLLASLPPHKTSDDVLKYGAQWTAYQGLPKAWERIANRAKIRDDTLHTLRHSFATIANMLRCSEPTIASMPGHSRRDRPLHACRGRHVARRCGSRGRRNRSRNGWEEVSKGP